MGICTCLPQLLRVIAPFGQAMALEQLKQFLAQAQREPALRAAVEAAITADAVAKLAQDLGYEVSGSELLRFSGQCAGGVRVTRIDHPGEVPGRYV